MCTIPKLMPTKLDVHISILFSYVLSELDDVISIKLARFTCKGG